MKIKTLILALPALCFACGTPTSPSDPAFQADASAVLAKKVTGVNMLVNDFHYEEPCHILGEEYIHQAFNLDEKTEITESHGHDGCEFSWAGNKVTVSFGGTRPFSSLEQADATFGKLYADGSAEVVKAVAETPASDSAEHEAEHAAHEAAPAVHHAVAKGNYTSIEGIGDKAAWDASTGALHVLYSNHIINVTVDSKGGAEQKKQQAETLADVLMEKIADKHYVKYL